MIESCKTTQELRMRIKQPTQENIRFFVIYRSPANLVFLFPCCNIIKCLNASKLTTAVFELVQHLYHVAEIRDDHGSGLKPILAGSELDRTAIFSKIGGSGLDRTETNFCCFSCDYPENIKNFSCDPISQVC